MSAADDERVDLEQISHLDFTPTCQVRVRGEDFCGHVALWSARCLGCRHVALCCAAHKSRIEGLALARCISCGSAAAGRHLVEFTSLGLS